MAGRHQEIASSDAQIQITGFELGKRQPELFRLLLWGHDFSFLASIVPMTGRLIVS
jgi:hypothetical protein